MLSLISLLCSENGLAVSCICRRPFPVSKPDAASQGSVETASVLINTEISCSDGEVERCAAERHRQGDAV